jgi:hypothetical protein
VKDFKTLIKFINSQLLIAPVGPNESHRNLLAYFNEKLSNPSNDRGDVRLMASRALKVEKLDMDRHSKGNSTLDVAGNEDLRARAAALLAVSVIRARLGVTRLGVRSQ